MAELLSDADIEAALADLPAWQRDGNAIVRTVESPSFPDAVALVDRVAEAAEAANHHPDIDIRWRKVTYSLSTHSAGGITASDVELARTIDSLVHG
ncbi:4a-hydroxytetrahydrobiopterin dehydratase [Rhodococcus sp. GXMU-t2271]|uniref:Putative pterin-4-alpha-carbinolamine dehydratase n=3 Tax=Rhodococcus TaxID=1827 RepID=M2ZY44_9NOCA|nr:MULTISPECIES: 4a-hydroxytetrahydrobiopterin dehydratase [Rhodococcus]EME65264.1 pterin-4-alpha-carbinolamine dehydratase [Rhodococcus ruber BKS 20-38]KOS56493.1 pterin-4-alpha-carbinolamine dehydratase [Rhodococcus rhodochrous KG-21]MDM7490590.1 4a-hydroxytetrahydrobiopterin dehydratase [Rhodococcus indonesiensis]